MFTDAPRRLVAEFIGAFTLTFIGAGAILTAVELDGYTLVGVAVAHGLAIGLMVCALGHVSGGHFNPAVSTAMLITRRLNPTEFVGYVVAQCVGAIVAALLLVLFYPEVIRDVANLGTPALAPTVSAGEGLLIEAILTFFLVIVIFGVAVDQRASFSSLTGLAIGLTITMGIFMGGPLTGAAMNPSRWIGPALVDNHWSDGWLYIVGPVAGAIVAALVYEHVIKPARAGQEQAESPDAT